MTTFFELNDSDLPVNIDSTDRKTPPSCQLCSREFIHFYALSMHLQCAAVHLSDRDDDSCILDGDDVLLAYLCGDNGSLEPVEDDSDGDCWWSDDEEDSSTASDSDASLPEIEWEYSQPQINSAETTLCPENDQVEYGVNISANSVVR
ncbi:hypothetical protein MIND_01221600 [Mycena indigotica]|uniref:C2H2-type domain-containing protein n=1 Tax=Mycena indigotica TaxID=2126181 RepID=A0A8H6S4B3_9AGAR|nr:uncharacterized protein MIND_01221600 [Mycena indigotica]KAF7291960.1 hypothetical protein MIND_01221600 [Mycena indigotica]